MRRKVRGFNKILHSHQEKGNGQGNGPASICGGLFSFRCTKSLLSLFYLSIPLRFAQILFTRKAMMYASIVTSPVIVTSVR